MRVELSDLRDELEAVARGPGTDFEDRYLDPGLLEKFLRLQELQAAVRGLVGGGELEEHLPASSALERILDGESYCPSRKALISRIIRRCPELEAADPVLSRLRKRVPGLDRGQDDGLARFHVGYIGWVLGTWELPRPCGVLSFPPAVAEAIAALAEAPTLAELPTEHAKTLITMLTDPEECGDWRDHTLSEARCPHCRSQHLSPVSEENHHAPTSLAALSFAHHPGKLYRLPLRHRICLDCGYVMAFVHPGNDGLGAVRKLLRRDEPR